MTANYGNFMGQRFFQQFPARVGRIDGRERLKDNGMMGDNSIGSQYQCLINKRVGRVKSNEYGCHFLIRIPDEKTHIVPWLRQTERSIHVETVDNIFNVWNHTVSLSFQVLNKKRYTPRGCTF